MADPAHLTRWWPRVERVEEVTERGWTNVLRSPRGRLVRADFTRVELEEPERVVWQQEIEESPFERILSRSVTEIVFEPADGGAGTQVTITVRQRLRGLARFGGFIVRRAAGRQLTEALEQLDEIAGHRE